MSTQVNIENKIQLALQPSFLAVENESHRHSGPATQSHFKLTVVSQQFLDRSPVQRHQQIYGLLAEELKAGVHALALHLYSNEEWQAKNQQAPDSPNCRGGSKAEL